MAKILSICIPTYNRKKKLKRLVDCICSQSSDLEGKIEICISDNASTDGTRQYIEELKESTSIEINVIFNDMNKGMDANIISALELAGSEYLWIMGDDDYISEGGLKKLVKFLEKITANENINLVYLTLSRQKLSKEEINDIISSEEMFKSPNGFMSTNVIRRKAFERIGKVMIRRGIGSGYEHAWVIRLLGLYLPDSKAIRFPYQLVCSESSHPRVTLEQQMKFERAFFYVYTRILWHGRNALGYPRYFWFIVKKVLLTMVFPFFEMLCERVFRPHGKEKISFSFFMHIFGVFSLLFWVYYVFLKILPNFVVKSMLSFTLGIIDILKLSRDSSYSHWQRFWEGTYNAEVTEKRDFFE